MSNGLKRVWTDLVRPLLRRPPGYQVAALCWRETDGKPEVLLITSRETHRWIVPKGWPIDGLSGVETALREAWEEAGVTGAPSSPPQLIGSYAYGKTQATGYALPVEVQVYKLHAAELSDTFPESGERQRKWVSPAEAATMVCEPGLQKILRAL